MSGFLLLDLKLFPSRTNTLVRPVRTFCPEASVLPARAFFDPESAGTLASKPGWQATLGQ